MADNEHCIVDVQRFKAAVWAVERENFRPGNALDALDHAKVQGETEPYELWVDKASTVLVRRWPDGSVEVSTRPDPGAIWGPPVQVFPERVS